MAHIMIDTFSDHKRGSVCQQNNEISRGEKKAKQTFVGPLRRRRFTTSERKETQLLPALGREHKISLSEINKTKRFFLMSSLY